MLLIRSSSILQMQDYRYIVIFKNALIPLFIQTITDAFDIEEKNISFELGELNSNMFEQMPLFRRKSFTLENIFSQKSTQTLELQWEDQEKIFHVVKVGEIQQFSHSSPSIIYPL